MLASNIKTVRNDMRTLMHDAQDLFREAATATGTKADELRAKGMELLDSASVKAREVQATALATGKEVAHEADAFVHEHPWKAVAIATGFGLMLGLLMARR